MGECRHKTKNTQGREGRRKKEEGRSSAWQGLLVLGEADWARAVVVGKADKASQDEWIGVVVAQPLVVFHVDEWVLSASGRTSGV